MLWVRAIARDIAFAFATLIVLAPANAAATSLNVPGSSMTLGTTIPTTFASGSSATSTFGANKTTATTSLSLGTNAKSFASALVIQSGSSHAQQTRIAYASATNLANIKSLNVTVGGTQILIANGVVTQSSGAPSTLAASGALTASINNAAKTTKAGTANLVFQVLTTEVTTGATLDETWTLNIS